MDNSFYVPEFYEIDPATLCQCTGLKDKNGKLICENDITKDPDYGYMKCIYHSGTFMWYSEKGFHIKFCAYTPNIKIKGNAIDNPELLEV